jgi:hypothetical protein
MGCPALGIWVAFLKQPDALPVRAPKKNKNYIFLTTFDSFVIFYLGFLFFRIFFESFFLVCCTRQCGLFQKSDPNPQSWTSHLSNND